MELIELNTTINPLALNESLLNLRGFSGLWWDSIEQHGPNNKALLFISDGTTSDDRNALLNIVNNHDPVRLSLDKTIIQANSLDVAVVTVDVPLGTPVTLLVSGVEVPVTLTNGIGTVEISANAPGGIPILVKNPQNRTTDTLTVEAK